MEKYTSPRDIIDRWRAKVLSSDAVAGTRGVLKLEVEGQEGGTWILDCSGPAPQIREGQSDADTTVRVSAENFVKIANRELNPQMAYITGLVRLEGDLRNALGFSALF